MRASVVALAGLLAVGCTADNPDFQQSGGSTSDTGSSTEGGDTEVTTLTGPTSDATVTTREETTEEVGPACGYHDEGAPFEIIVGVEAPGGECLSNSGSGMMSFVQDGEFLVEACMLGEAGGCETCAVAGSVRLFVDPPDLAPVIPDGDCVDFYFGVHEEQSECMFDYLQLFQNGGDERPFYTASGHADLDGSARFALSTDKVWLPDQCNCTDDPDAECCQLEPGGWAISFLDLEGADGEAPIVPTGGEGSGTFKQGGSDLEYELSVPRAFVPLACDDRPTFQWVASAFPPA